MMQLGTIRKLGWRKWARRRLDVPAAYAADMLLPKREDRRKLVIFAQGRTGSTLLEKLLCSTGYFRESGELLSSSFGEIRYPLRFVRGMARMGPGSFVFHLKVYQLTRDRSRPVDPAGFLKALQADGWKFVHLMRRNRLRHAFSNLLLEYRGHPQKLTNSEERPKLVVDCSDLERIVDERFRFASDEQRALEGIPHHRVVYEDDLEDSGRHQETVDGILEMMSLETRPVSTELRRINVYRLEELVENWDDVLQLLRRRGWERFLNGPEG